MFCRQAEVKQRMALQYVFTVCRENVCVRVCYLLSSKQKFALVGNSLWHQYVCSLIAVITHFIEHLPFLCAKFTYLHERICVAVLVPISQRGKYEIFERHKFLWRGNVRLRWRSITRSTGSAEVTFSMTIGVMRQKYWCGFAITMPINLPF